MDNYAIVVENLRKSFKKLTVLDGVDFAVARGSILALLGPNGAGKTTTVRILSTLLPPGSGRVLVNGFDVVKQAHDVRSSIGLTGQYAAVDEYLTGDENLQMMGRLYRLHGGKARQRSWELLERFDLTEAAARPVKTYSGGMRRRLDLAISLIASPPLIFLDEPTTGLDPRSRLTMWEMVRSLAAGGTTILLTTQYMDEADQLADKVVVIDNGKVIADGTIDELKARVGSGRITLTIAKGNDFDIAQRALGAEILSSDAQRRTVSIVARDGITGIREVLNRLENAAVDVDSLSLHRPTLDDVFLSLTGHGTGGGGREGDKTNLEPEDKLL
ncbi:MAG TPA: ATP-binding cassette domain-containing protein [Anseongella sp.]|nr:ATP-binding cassette domain-containing protein [Anseongella sp.]